MVFITIFLNRQTAMAQGGPPMLLDDSGVPGDGKWENNLAFVFEGSQNDNARSFPIVDLNYGVGDRIQLKTELTWVAEKGDKLANKFDNITFGFKYVFLDEKKDGVSVSVHLQPIISFNPEEEGKSVEFGALLPVAISKTIAGIGVNVQGGYQKLGGKAEWTYGFCISHDFGESLTMLAELHSTIGRASAIGVDDVDVSYFKEGTFFNVGANIKLSDKYVLLPGFGKDLESPRLSSGDAVYYTYIGLQFLM